RLARQLRVVQVGSRSGRIQSADPTRSDVAPCVLDPHRVCVRTRLYSQETWSGNRASIGWSFHYLPHDAAPLSSADPYQRARKRVLGLDPPSASRQLARSTTDVSAHN